ncbi:MAG: TIGR04211 family SH3 domain-containing protein [Deltaproteobacteria bacterium]|nr:TIGR04211 family SH3 domain-containing protein [Deltaproteobacteria bacterium]
MHSHVSQAQHKYGVKSLLAIFILCLAPGLALAQNGSRWISDQFEVTVRNGKNTQQSILKLLPSGARVTILEQDEESGYTRVRTEDGTEGWMLTRYLMTSPAARDRIPVLQTRLRNSEETKRSLQARVQELEREKTDLLDQLGQAEVSSRRMQRQIVDIRKASSNTIKVFDENKELKQKLIEAEKHNQKIEAENQSLLTSATRKWFMVGAGVLLIGLVLGLLVPHMNGQRKSKIALPP